MSCQKNNEGMTLIELIITMAIMAIVLSIMALIISTAIKSFKRTSESVDVQMEAQVAVNQISNLLMESNGFENSTTNLISSDDIKYLIDSLSNWYVVYYSKDKMKLYLYEYEKSRKSDAEQVRPTESDDTDNQYLLAEYINNFIITLTNNKTANIEIDFKIGDEPVYQVTKKVSLRNVK